MAKGIEKLQALKMRREGMSIKAIAKVLEVTKGSVSGWCENIQLSPSQQQKLKEKQIKAGHAGRMKGAEMNRQKRLTQIAKYETEGLSTVHKLSARDLLMLGIGLYWGEGVKARNSTTAIINSDPAIVLIAKRWFQECLGVIEEDFSPYIYISETHRGRENKIAGFWSSLLGLSVDQFHPVVFLKGRREKVYENHDMYYGVLALRVRRGSELKYRILGLIKACQDPAEVAQLVRASHS